MEGGVNTVTFENVENGTIRGEAKATPQNNDARIEIRMTGRELSAGTTCTMQQDINKAIYLQFASHPSKILVHDRGSDGLGTWVKTEKLNCILPRRISIIEELEKFSHSPQTVCWCRKIVYLISTSWLRQKLNSGSDALQSRGLVYGVCWVFTTAERNVHYVYFHVTFGMII